MGYVFITAGNVSSATFENVCYAVALTFDSTDIIHIFDTKESEEIAIRDGRTTSIRNILGMDIDIRTSRVNDDSLQTIIPNRISRLMKEFGPSKLIVDLTNGRKITASILYAVAAIARVAKIYSLEMKINPRTLSEDVRLPQLERGEQWEYVSIETLEEVNNITRNSQIELIYYRDWINRVCELIQSRNSILAREYRRSLRNALVDYFSASVDNQNRGNYERIENCIVGLGKICEAIAKLAYESYQNVDSEAKTSDFRTHVNRLTSVWERGQKQLAGLPNNKQKERWTLGPEFLEEVVKPTLPLGGLLPGIIVYRNYAAHPGNYYELTIQDARFVLSATLLLLERVGNSNIISSG